MSRVLRLVLTSIVLVNLAFVHATEDASLLWLAPLYAIALASPWLARLSGSAAYRWIWNFAVIGIFAVLVRHTAVAGPRYLLEDGLRLAAVCQVHVLCTLGPRQKPDLLFFNSFLIAVVTAFLTQDLVYSAVFLAYAPLFVLGLSLYAAEASGAVGEVVRPALVHAAFALGATFLVFFVCPRDFHRKGLVVESLALGPAAVAPQVGFTDEVRFGRHGAAGSSDAVVLRARVVEGHPEDVGGYWRGATLLCFDGERWDAGRCGSLGDAAWRPSGPHEISRDLEGDGPSVEVDLVDPSAARLFAPLCARRAAIDSAEIPGEPAGRPDGTLQYVSATDGRPGDDVRYRLDLGGPPREPGGVTPEAPPELAPALSLRESPRLPAIERLAARLRASLPSDAPQHAVVETMRESLASRTDYLAPGSPDAASDLDTFVSGRAGGHCEHFASALALLLRHAKVPCRLVTGFASEDWNEQTRTLTVRSRDAHAWVEVKDPEAGWYTVDPTPAYARAVARRTSLAAVVGAWFERAWARIVSFDDSMRKAVVGWFASLPGLATDFVRADPLLSCVAAALSAALIVVQRRSRARRVAPEVRAYRRCLARLRLAPRPGETPRDLVVRAAREGLPRDAVERLDAATQRHEAMRYATMDARRDETGLQ